MWSFYGSKSKTAHLYPTPLYDDIWESFAGSARYSLLHWEHKVHLVEKDDKVYRIWKWLQECSPSDILSLPSMKAGESTDDFSFACVEAKWLMGFMINQGSASPKKKVSSTGSFGSADNEKKRIASNIHKIKHWEIICGSYETHSPNVKATWYIDPPYFSKGIYYRESSKNIDFEALAKWCRSRTGQVIVCENEGATWLPFKFLAETNGSIKKSKEVIWYKLNQHNQ